MYLAVQIYGMPTTHCTICGVSREDSPVKFHRNQCNRCHNQKASPTKHRECNQDRYQRYKAGNTCIICGRPAEDGRKKCREHNTYYNQWARNRRRKLRLAAFDRYGKTCAYCGEYFEPFLSIDHIDDKGGEHRRTMGRSGYAIYEWLAKNKYPDGFQVLCIGCNMAKYKLGVEELHSLLREAGRLVYNLDG